MCLQQTFHYSYQTCGWMMMMNQVGEPFDGAKSDFQEVLLKLPARYQ